MAKKSRFGTVRTLNSGRHQAFYSRNGETHKADRTFVRKGDAKAWLSAEEHAISNGTWIAPSKRISIKSPDLDFETYCSHYMEVKRTNGSPIQDSTKHLYRKLLKHQLSQFHGANITDISQHDVDTWFQALTATNKRTSAGNAYKFLRAVMSLAVREGHISKNPCQIAGAQSASSGHTRYTPTLIEVLDVAKAIDPQYRLMTLVCTYGVLRFGELAALTRGDLRRMQNDVSGDSYFELSISKQVKNFDGKFHVGQPKSKAGVRTIPLHHSLTAEIDAHLAQIGKARTSLLFANPTTGTYMRNDLYEHRLKLALTATGHDGKGWTVHSLRHAGATAYANANANIAEIQRILGDSSPTAALRYIGQTGRTLQLSASLQGIN